LHLDQVLQALVDVVVHQLHADKAGVHVWDPVRQRLAVRAAHGFSPEMIARMSAYGPGDGIAGQVFQTGEVIAIEDTTEAPYPAGQIAANEGISSVLSVPIKINNQVFGVFGLNYCQARTFSADEKRLFTALAQRAAIAIENARLYEQAEQAATLEERQRLARELHDSVTQSLYSLVLLSETGRRYAVAGEMDKVEHNLERLGETARQALQEMRLLVYELRPLALAEVGLAGALQQRLNAVEQRAGIQGRLFVENLPALPPHLEEQLYRIAQESLNNTLKHAHASHVSLHLRCRANTLELEIQDNGQGFEQKSENNGG
jgi:signal transduction histidine kinase